MNVLYLGASSRVNFIPNASVPSSAEVDLTGFTTLAMRICGISFPLAFIEFMAT